MFKKIGVILLFVVQFITAQQNYNSKQYRDSLDVATSFFLNYDCDKSLKISNNIVAVATKNKDHKLLAMAYNLIGLNFEELKPGSVGLEYFDYALEHATLAKNDTIKTWIYNNIGNYYLYNDIDPKLGLDFYLKSVMLSEQLKIKNYQTLLDRLNLVIAFYDTNQHEKGFKYLSKIKPELDKYNNVDSYISFYSLMAEYYEIKKDTKNAEANYLKAIEYSKNVEFGLFTKSIVNIMRSTASFYKKNNDYKKAYQYLKQVDSLSAVFQKKEANQDLDDISKKVKISEQNRRKEQFLSEQKLQKEKNRNNKLIIISITLFLICVLGYLVYAVRLNRNKKEANLKLQLANEELTKAKNVAEEASVYKTKFLSTISHEIRTPLYGIVGMTDIIYAERKENGLEGSTKHLDALQFSANYLLSLVNDVLNLSKIEENKFELNNSPFCLSKEIETIKQSLAVLAKKYNNNLEFHIDDDVPKFINSDKLRISQIIINLISNSLKFTHNGDVKLYIGAKDIKPNSCNLIIKVIDNGVGIPDDAKELIFDKFVQLERREDDYQGTGLGLSIVKNLVSFFNGSIKLFSEVSKGSTFTITLPIDVVDEMPMVELPKDKGVVKNLSILMVEDNRINQMVTKKMIDNMGYSCDVIDNGFDAVELLKTKSYDLILMDINMPQINGFETTELIRKLGVKIPIYALTAFDISEVEVDALKAGMQAVLTKPVKANDLFSFIESQF